MAGPGGDIRKGMTMAEVEQVLREAVTTNRTEGSIHVVNATYTRGEQVITAEFVEGVLTKYSIASK